MPLETRMRHNREVETYIQKRTKQNVTVPQIKVYSLYAQAIHAASVQIIRHYRSLAEDKNLRTISLFWILCI